MDNDALIAMLAYCHVAFNGYHSVMKRNSTIALLTNFMKELFQLSFLLRINKNNSNAQISDLLFNAMQLFLDQKKGEVEQPAAASCRPLPHPLHLRIRHSPGKSIDFALNARNGNRVLTMTRQQNDMPFSGPEIRLDQLVECACSISMDKLMSVLCINEWSRNNPGRITAQLLSLFADREILSATGKLVMLFIKTYLPHSERTAASYL
jgi:magnesium-protoporphyrin IX monomethyl ester (oxidative) cyclase